MSNPVKYTTVRNIALGISILKNWSLIHSFCALQKLQPNRLQSCVHCTCSCLFIQGYIYWQKSGNSAHTEFLNGLNFSDNIESILLWHCDENTFAVKISGKSNEYEETLPIWTYLTLHMIGKIFIYNKHFPFAYEKSTWMKTMRWEELMRSLFKPIHWTWDEELSLFFLIREEFLSGRPNRCRLLTKTLPNQCSDKELCPHQSAPNMIVYIPLYSSVINYAAVNYTFVIYTKDFFTCLGKQILIFQVDYNWFTCASVAQHVQLFFCKLLVSSKCFMYLTNRDINCQGQPQL